MFSLQPSKLDLDVFIAIGQVDLDAGKYPNIAQWKKLVMSYSEATQQRLHFICFNFKLIHQFWLLYFFPSFFLSPSPFPLPLSASPPPIWLTPSLPPHLTSLPPCLFSSLPHYISLFSTLPPFPDSCYPSLSLFFSPSLHLTLFHTTSLPLGLPSLPPFLHYSFTWPPLSLLNCLPSLPF